MSQCQEGVSDRFKPIASPLRGEVARVVHRPAQPRRLSLMPADTVELRGIDQNLLFRCLYAQDVGDMAGRHGVPVRFELDTAVVPADPQGDFGGVVRMKRQDLQRRLFLLHKQVDGGALRGVVDVQVGLLPEPPPCRGPQVLHVLKLPSCQQVALDILKRRFDLSFGLGASRSACDGLALVMRDERGERGVEDRPAALPSQDNRFFVVVQTLFRDSLKVLEGVLMPPDQTVVVMTRREVDVLSARKAQHIGETLHRTAAGPGKAQRIGAPIHLPLSARVRFKPDHRIPAGLSQSSQQVPQDADPSGIALVPDLLMHPHRREIRVCVQQLPDLLGEAVQFARPRERPGERFVSRVPPVLMGPEDSPDCVAGCLEVPA